MITIISALFFIYIALKLYISISQISYISQRRKEEPFLLSKEEYLQAGNYGIEKEKLSLFSTILEYALFIFWINDGLQFLSATFSELSPTLETLAFVFGFLAINWLVSLPLEFYQKFVIDEKYGFNKSTKKLYLLDTVKEIALSLIIGTPIIIGISALISFEYWWLWTFFSIFALMIFINMVYPTLIAPIFNKMSKLENSELESEIETLLKRVGFKSSGVFVMDASKRDSRLNAYFGGFGKTKRVVLFDTLVEKLQNRELLAVLGHELGHFKNGDIYKNIGMVGFLLFSIFYVLGNIPTELFETLKLEESPQIFIAFFVLFSPLFSLFIMPLFGYISRKNEYGADEVGSELAGSPLYLKEALKKLVTENKHFPNSHYLYIFFYYTHPPLAERFEALENLK